MTAELLIGEPFLASLARLADAERAQAAGFLAQFYSDRSHPSFELHQVERSPSRNLWSARINQDLRAILYKDGSIWAVLFAGHHEAAYQWAERRNVDRHPVTGALQVVQTVESTREVERVIPIYRTAEQAPLFGAHADLYLSSLGVPLDWLPTIREIRDEEQLLDVCAKLPDPVSDRLMRLAGGELVTPPPPVPLERPASEAPDTRDRFVLVDDLDGLRSVLGASLDRWLAFLHPSQRRLVEGHFKGPVKVSGGAGTGKTVVAMHRARWLARRGERVLLATFVTTLCDNLRRNLARLCNPAELERISVSTVHKLALDLVHQVEPDVQPAGIETIRTLLDEAAARHAPHFPASFVRAEWENVLQPQGIASWDEYRAARRTGRGRPLSVTERKLLWQVFAAVVEGLATRGLCDWSGLCRRAEALVAGGQAQHPYSAVVIDEVQDLKAPELSFLRSLAGIDPGNLMLCGDSGQRIYPGGFSLQTLGIDVRGRSRVLRINYRTTEQIRRAADQLLGSGVDDLDGGLEGRGGTRCLLRGPEPMLTGSNGEAEENEAGVAKIRRWLAAGVAPEAIAVFARTRQRLEAFEQTLGLAGLPSQQLADQRGAAPQAGIQLGTMHRAKGLEFKAVLLLGCGADTLPSPQALRGQADPQDREDVEARERRLLYVAMTRARDELAILWAGRPSPFLAALQLAAEEKP